MVSTAAMVEVVVRVPLDDHPKASHPKVTPHARFAPKVGHTTIDYYNRLLYDLSRRFPSKDLFVMHICANSLHKGFQTHMQHIM